MTRGEVQSRKRLLRESLPGRAATWGVTITEITTDGFVLPATVRVTAFDSTGSTSLDIGVDETPEFEGQSLEMWGDMAMNVICALLVEQLHAKD